MKTSVTVGEALELIKIDHDFAIEEERAIDLEDGGWATTSVEEHPEGLLLTYTGESWNEKTNDFSRHEPKHFLIKVTEVE